MPQHVVRLDMHATPSEWSWLTLNQCAPQIVQMVTLLPLCTTDYIIIVVKIF